MITQTFKMLFQCVMWITRHSSIWIANTSIHCSLPSQLRKLCKKWVMTLSSSMAMYSVMRDIPDARNVPMERGWVALYLYATCKFSNLLTLEQWAFEYGLPLFDTHCISTIMMMIIIYFFLHMTIHWQCDWSQDVTMKLYNTRQSWWCAVLRLSRISLFFYGAKMKIKYFFSISIYCLIFHSYYVEKIQLLNNVKKPYKSWTCSK